MSLLEADNFRDRCDHCQRFDLFDMINDALVLVKSQTGDILFMNEKALKMYQYTSEESLKLSIASIRHDSASLINENMRTAKQYTSGYVFTANHIKKDGSIFKVEVSTRFMTLHGTEIFASVVRNLTPDLKMREEVELAGKVQRRLLPRDIDEKLFCTRSIYQPHNYVSGDLYDFAFDDHNRVLHGILIDVMGHGISAAFQTNILKYLFRKIMGENITVNDKLAWMNKEVMPFFAGGGFAGVFLFELDFKCSTLTYSAGGINHFIILKGQGAEVIKAPGLFLGINEDEIFDQDVCYFESGESFLFLTDGLFELISQSISSEFDFWGMQEMCKLLISKVGSRDDASGVGVFIR
ncbi:MAG: SpoIIE family protein phosphatase [Sporomusaceae bacterium]|nr:SpoIIE family protein phosphatase [Sporomusaceae bacterium]